ncbi:MAG: hypothetical protein IT339_08065 [Thermomicrobiales bacterium]|nr:hypothetical protein [Thermomicrobiales bacterium]
MTLVLRLITLLTIGAAGFAMPITCAQSGAAAPARTVIVSIPAAQQLDASTVDLHRFAEGARGLAEHLLDRGSSDCGKTAPRAGQHPATLATQPFVPGYLTSAPMQYQAPPRTIDPPPAPILLDSRAGPPDVPPPRALR